MICRRTVTTYCNLILIYLTAQDKIKITLKNIFIKNFTQIYENYRPSMHPVILICLLFFKLSLIIKKNELDIESTCEAKCSWNLMLFLTAQFKQKTVEFLKISAQHENFW